MIKRNILLMLVSIFLACTISTGFTDSLDSFANKPDSHMDSFADEPDSHMDSFADEPDSHMDSFADEPDSHIDFFTDLKEDHWAYRSVMEMKNTGIISGYQDGSFRPNSFVTYGEFIKMATVASGAIGIDVKARSGEHWVFPYYEAGLNNFYFSEWDISEKVLNIPIPRKHMALIASGAMGWQVNIADYGDYSNIQNSISDVDGRNPYEYEIVKAYAVGVLSGYPDESFKPDGVLSRAEAASVIDRLAKVTRGRKENEDESSEIIDGKTEKNNELNSDTSKTRRGPFRDDLYDLVTVEENPPGSPNGTVDFIMFYYDQNTEARYAELLKELKARYPKQADAMYGAFQKFAGKPVPEKKQGMRKQFFGEYPVLMEHYRDTLVLCVLPVGYDDPYWEVKPGQVYESFF